MKSRCMDIVVRAGIFALLTGLAACATTQPPKELVNAREAFAESKRSAAADYDPAALHEAKVALDRAEKLYKEDGDEPRMRDVAYIAMRRAERAKVEGETAQLNARAQDAKTKAAEQQADAARAARE